MYKLIFRHISVSQLLAFVLSNIVGLYIVIMGVQVYMDVKPILTSDDSFVKPEHIVISKKVHSWNAISSKSLTFTPSELAEIKEQPFVKDVAGFIPATFNVYASVGSRATGNLATDMFFEAIPTKFMDVDLDNWQYNQEDDFLPVIIPRNYLNLYNFGFASSQGLPVISEQIIANIPIQFVLRGQKGSMTVYGKIVGFSDRFNTILVPLDFIQWANAKLSGAETVVSARAIVEVKNVADEQISTFFANRNYEVENNITDASKAKSFLLLLVGGVVLVGLLICCLSIYILMLSIFLLIQKMTEQIDNLLLIGYTTRLVSRPYSLLSMLLNVLCFVIAVALLAFSRNFYLEKLTLLYEFEIPSMVVSVVGGILLCTMISLINTWVITKKVTSIWHIHKK